MNITTLLTELDQAVDAVSELTEDTEYIEAWEAHQVNQRLVWNGYSFEVPQRIQKIFDRYHDAHGRVRQFKENDNNPSITAVQAGELGHLYDAIKLN
jgi:hypothetical protein